MNTCTCLKIGSFTTSTLIQNGANLHFTLDPAHGASMAFALGAFCAPPQCGLASNCRARARSSVASVACTQISCTLDRQPKWSKIGRHMSQSGKASLKITSLLSADLKRLHAPPLLASADIVGGGGSIPNIPVKPTGGNGDDSGSQPEPEIILSEVVNRISCPAANHCHTYANSNAWLHAPCPNNSWVDSAWSIVTLRWPHPSWTHWK